MTYENKLLNLMEEKVFEMANAVDEGTLKLDNTCLERLIGSVVRIMAAQCSDYSKLAQSAIFFLSAETPGDYEDCRDDLAYLLMDDAGYTEVCDYKAGIHMWIKKKD